MQWLLSDILEFNFEGTTTPKHVLVLVQFRASKRAKTLSPPINFFWTHFFACSKLEMGPSVACEFGPIRWILNFLWYPDGAKNHKSVTGIPTAITHLHRYQACWSRRENVMLFPHLGRLHALVFHLSLLFGLTLGYLAPLSVSILGIIGRFTSQNHNTDKRKRFVLVW